jgi:hypothetical protein
MALVDPTEARKATVRRFVDPTEARMEFNTRRHSTLGKPARTNLVYRSGLQTRDG